MNRAISISIFIFWILVVVIYPMLVSMYVTIPLFIGFAGLMFVKGLEEDNYFYIIFSFVYMLNLEVNLSLPFLLILIATLFFYFFIKSKLVFLKMCKICINILTVIAINLIYYILILAYDFISGQSSIEYNIALLFSLLYDIIAAILI